MNLHRMTMLAAILAATGCSFRTKSATISPADVARPERTLITNLLSSAVGTEQAPGTIAQSAVVDEAMLVKLDGREVCVRVRLRTGANIDMPLGEWQATLNQQPVRLVEEDVSSWEQPYTERVAETVVQGSSHGHEYSEVQYTDVEHTAQVVTRTGTACAPTQGLPDRVQLDLRLLDASRDNQWGENFMWMVTR